MKRYKQLFEAKLPKEIALKFGEILFGSHRDKEEKDTEYEAKVFEMISDWVIGKYMRDNVPKNDIMKVLKDLHKLRDYYSDILIPKNSLLYRVTKELPQKLTETDFEQKGDNYYSKKQYPYTPKSFAQSWTHSLDSAIQFQGSYSKGIIMKTKFNNKDLLFNREFLNSVGDSLSIDNIENEIIHIGNSPIKVTYILIPSSYKHYIES